MLEKFKELNPDFLQSQPLQKLNYILNPKLELLSYVAKCTCLRPAPFSVQMANCVSE